MNTKIMEYILTIAEEKNVSRAAERCYLSQPMLSLHLKKVEEEYGAALFTRTPEGMQLTQAGILFVNNARSILYQQTQLEKKLEALRHSQQHFFRLLLDESYYNFYVRTVQEPLKQHHPAYEVQVQITSRQQALRDLAEHRADAAIFITDEAVPEEFLARTMFKDMLVPVVPPNFPIPQNGLQGVFEAGLPPLLHPVGTTVRTLEEKALVAAHVFPSQILETRAFHITLSYVQTLLCCGFLPKQLFDQNPQYHLQALAPVCSLDCVLVYSPERESDTSFQAILQELEAAFRTFPEENERFYLRRAAAAAAENSQTQG